MTDIDELLEQARTVEVTPREREEQALSFAYGNLAMSTNHLPTRSVFNKLALQRGWTQAEFDAWADARHAWRAEPEAE